MNRTVIALAAVLALSVLPGCGSDGDRAPARAGKGTELVGTFRLEPGRCTAKGAAGSYFRMINRGGTVADGPFFGNPDSPCKDKSFNVQVPGSDGGLVTGSYQPNPKVPFDKGGNAVARRIAQPGSFTAIKFGISTEKVDPGTKKRNPEPAIFVEDGKLTGQITAWTASWNNLYFNQGSPKPGGGTPGLTVPVSGTYDAATGRFVLTWVSGVVGGPFDKFAGAWHLEGTFEPANRG
ncbi:hypothetical protein ABIE44_000454 [Marmoricola sp. OAE513]|uniref:hypothetical protein n=1 Tax=Marmoricola sp. OAE513 TaxID=2817894 RepID=UPI001AE4817D